MLPAPGVDESLSRAALRAHRPRRRRSVRKCRRGGVVVVLFCVYMCVCARDYVRVACLSFRRDVCYVVVGYGRARDTVRV